MLSQGLNLFPLDDIGPSIIHFAAAAFTYLANHWLSMSLNHASSTSSVEIHAACTIVFTNSALFILSHALNVSLEASNIHATARASTYGENQSHEETSSYACTLVTDVIRTIATDATLAINFLILIIVLNKLIKFNKKLNQTIIYSLINLFKKSQYYWSDLPVLNLLIN